MKPFPYHTVFLTGASGGLGRSLTRALIQEGCLVIGTGRSADKLEAFRNTLGEKKDAFVPLPFDIRNEAAWDQVIAVLREKNLMPDLIIQNAGVLPPFAGFRATSPAVFRQTWETNFAAPVMSTRKWLEVCPEQTGFYFIGSSNAIAPIGGTGAYSAAKGALCNWTSCLAEELRGRYYIGTAILGFVKTDIFRYQHHSAEHRLIDMIAADPDQTARKILKAIRKKKQRKVFGTDARLMCPFSAVFPVWATKVYRWAMVKSRLPLFSDIYSDSSDCRTEAELSDSADSERNR